MSVDTKEVSWDTDVNLYTPDEVEDILGNLRDINPSTDRRTKVFGKQFLVEGYPIATDLSYVPLSSFKNINSIYIPLPELSGYDLYIDEFGRNIKVKNAPLGFEVYSGFTDGFMASEPDYDDDLGDEEVDRSGHYRYRVTLQHGLTALGYFIADKGGDEQESGLVVPKRNFLYLPSHKFTLERAKILFTKHSSATNS